MEKGGQKGNLFILSKKKHCYHIKNCLTMIEGDVLQCNSINLRFLVGAMECTGTLPQEKDTQCFVRDLVNSEEAASVCEVSEVIGKIVRQEQYKGE